MWTGDLHGLQQQHKRWVNHNFPNQLPHEPLLGVVEEVGELSHHHLKSAQGIRGTHEEHRAAIADAIGDIVIYLASYCVANDFDLEACVGDAWQQVSERDWQSDPLKGERHD
jgi:NTP pyrophosphatase (non-canonical NTP hydrolase)